MKGRKSVKKERRTCKAIYPFNSGDGIVRNGGTHNDVLELDILARFGVAFHRLDVANDLSILTGTTGRSASCGYS